MTKEVLKQYSDLKKEKKEVEERIKALRKRIDNIRNGETVKDTVKGGMGGIQHFVVEGVPGPEYDKLIVILRNREKRLHELKGMIEETIAEVEDYIASIDNSRMRRIITAKHIQGKSWVSIAHMVGGNATEESVRKEYERYMAK